VPHQPGAGGAVSDGQSLGAQKVVKNTHVMWKVKYAPGAIEARGRRAAAGADSERETRSRGQSRAPAGSRAHRRRWRRCLHGDGGSGGCAGRVVPVAANEVSFKVSAAASCWGCRTATPAATNPTRATSAGRSTGWPWPSSRRASRRRDASGGIFAGVGKRHGNVACEPAKARRRWRECSAGVL